MQHELDYLIPTLNQSPILAEKTIEIERNPQRPARKASLTVWGMQLTLPMGSRFAGYSLQPDRLRPLIWSGNV